MPSAVGNRSRDAAKSCPSQQGGQASQSAGTAGKPEEAPKQQEQAISQAPSDQVSLKSSQSLGSYPSAGTAGKPGESSDAQSYSGASGKSAEGDEGQRAGGYGRGMAAMARGKDKAGTAGKPGGYGKGQGKMGGMFSKMSEKMGGMFEKMGQKFGGMFGGAGLGKMFGGGKNSPDAGVAGKPGSSGGYGAPAASSAGTPQASTGGGYGSPAAGTAGVPGQAGGVTGQPAIDPTQPGGAVPGQVDPTTGIASPVDRNIDFTQLGTDERSALGLNDRDRAVLHMWGRQVISTGKNDGGIYNNVMQNPTQFTEAEGQLINELAAREQAQYGGITGKALDQEFFSLLQRMNPGEQIDVSKYLNTPVQFAQGPIDITSDVNTLAQRTGLTQDEQYALRLWGHDPLFNGGTIDGSVLPYTLANNNALDHAAKGGAGSDPNLDGFINTLLRADLASDGVQNGDSLKSAFGSVLDKVYLGGAGLDTNAIEQQAVNQGLASGRTMQQIGQDMTQGVQQLMDTAVRTVKNHPVMSAAAIGGVAAATAICPFLGGMAAGGAGIAAAAGRQ